MAKVLMIAMSLRKDSFNKKVIKNAYNILKEKNASLEFELLSLNDFPMPMYDGDIESNEGIPETVKILGQKISEAQAIIISTPEYNGSIPGTFKNVIDWVSRIKPMPWPGKHVLLLGASPGAFGAIRSLWHSRQPLEATGVFVFPESLPLPLADQAFDDKDEYKDPKTKERLEKMLTKFCTYLEKQN